VSFEDSDVVRSAIRIEGFRDDEFNYQLIRSLGVADYGGSTVGECLAVVAEIADGSPRSWALAFEGLARRIEDRGRACLDAGHRVSGRDHLLRASTYYRTADYYADGVEGGSGDLGGRSQECFAHAAALMERPVEPVEVPFEGGSLPGYFVRPSPSLDSGIDGRRPTLVGVGASTRAPRSSTSTSERPGPSVGGTCSSSTGPVSPDACVAMRR
jgi:hypothetical protein